MCSNTININIGLLGHVDSGKTSLAKCLSQINSTACFDKHPQSQERGITIDLGFSCFSTDASENLQKLGYDKVQYTLVDCPGHASLIRTIIGGVNIIDLVLLVVDITKGVQTQTAECLIITEVAKRRLLVVLNKIDMIEENERQLTVKKVRKKMEITLSKNYFDKDIPIIPISSKCPETSIGIDTLINALKDYTVVPERYPEKPLIFSIDHCFSIRGKGTIMTGTILQGTLKLNDNIEIPELKVTKKIKSIQMFRQDVRSASQGDRIGVCVKHFDPKLLERGLACTPDSVPLFYGAIIEFHKIKYFKAVINSKAKYHITVGYETLSAKITLFSNTVKESFNIEKEFEYLESYFEEEDNNVGTIYALLEFEKPVYIPPCNEILIGSKLDINIHSHSCRIAFFGKMLHRITDKNYKDNLLPRLKIYKNKEKSGIVSNICNENEVIGLCIFGRETKMHQFVNLKVSLSTGESGFISSPFGHTGKAKISIPEGLKSTTQEVLVNNKRINSMLRRRKLTESKSDLEEKLKEIKIIVKFKRYIFDKSKKLIQDV